MLKKWVVLVVVPVPEHDGELLVVRVRLGGRVNDDGRTEAVDVLALAERGVRESAGAGRKDRDARRRGHAPSRCPTGQKS